MSTFLIPERKHRVAKLSSHGRRAANHQVRNLPLGLACWISFVVWPPEDPRSLPPSQWPGAPTS
jgi:hypothetical protein